MLQHNAPSAGSFRYKTGHTVQITGLKQPIRKTDLQGAFGDFGDILQIDLDVETGRGWIEFENELDAEDAIRDMNGKKIKGSPVQVEQSTGRNDKTKPAPVRNCVGNVSRGGNVITAEDKRRAGERGRCEELLGIAPRRGQPVVMSRRHHDGSPDRSSMSSVVDRGSAGPAAGAHEEYEALMAQMMAQMAQDTGGAGAEAEYQQYQQLMAAGMGTEMEGMVGLETVQAFIMQNGLDEIALRALLAESPEVQHGVISAGPLANTGNPSSTAILFQIRIRDQRKKSGRVTGVATGAAMGGATAGGSSAATAAPGVHDFIRVNRLDANVSRQLLAEHPRIQQAVMKGGPLSTATNPSAAAMGRIRNAKTTAGAMVGPIGQTNPVNMQSPGETPIQRFIKENRLDARIASQLLAEPLEIQQVVINGGPLTNANNPSSAAMGRLRNAKRMRPY